MGNISESLILIFYIMYSEAAILQYPSMKMGDFLQSLWWEA